VTGSLRAWLDRELRATREAGRAGRFEQMSVIEAAGTRVLILALIGIFCPE
jgi:hypothetical protein